MKVTKKVEKNGCKCFFKYHAKLNSNNSGYEVWQQNSRPKIIVQFKFAQQKLNYIHYNPIRAGYVDFSKDYP